MGISKAKQAGTTGPGCSHAVPTLDDTTLLAEENGDTVLIS